MLECFVLEPDVRPLVVWVGDDAEEGDEGEGCAGRETEWERGRKGERAHGCQECPNRPVFCFFFLFFTLTTAIGHQ